MSNDPRILVLEAINNHFELDGKQFNIDTKNYAYPEFLNFESLLPKQVVTIIEDFLYDRHIQGMKTFGNLSVAGVTPSGRHYLRNFS